MRRETIIVRFLSLKKSMLAKKYGVDAAVFRETKRLEAEGVIAWTRSFLAGCFYTNEEPKVIELYWDFLVKYYRTHWRRKSFIWLGVLIKLQEAFLHEVFHCLEHTIPISFKFEGEVRIDKNGLPY